MHYAFTRSPLALYSLAEDASAVNAPQSMAYGLRKITGTNYWPYGNGRDWFFVGDLDYMHGRRTPEVMVRQRADKLTPPLKTKKGHPRDMVFSRASIALSQRQVSVPVPGGCGYGTLLPVETLNRWRSLQDLDSGEDCNLARWRQQRGGSRDADEVLRARCSATLSATLKGRPFGRTLSATSSELGSRQRFDASATSLGDKYRSFSMPIRDPARWDFLERNPRASTR
ncbi:unnamed protein product [Durusdinium trenchii]|uniref:Uncharacterized protein n=1 Tax=Durusdinium trenchii TaxID=1381693 RepID=A0ABP0JYF8_9DINO